MERGVEGERESPKHTCCARTSTSLLRDSLRGFGPQTRSAGTAIFPNCGHTSANEKLCDDSVRVCTRRAMYTRTRTYTRTIGEDNYMKLQKSSIIRAIYSNYYSNRPAIGH